MSARTWWLRATGWTLLGAATVAFGVGMARVLATAPVADPGWATVGTLWLIAGLLAAGLVELRRTLWTLVDAAERGTDVLVEAVNEQSHDLYGLLHDIRDDVSGFRDDAHVARDGRAVG